MILKCFESFLLENQDPEFWEYSEIFDEIKEIPKGYFKSSRIEKKMNQWRYWYPDGKLKRIENYKLRKDLNHENGSTTHP